STTTTTAVTTTTTSTDPSTTTGSTTTTDGPTTSTADTTTTPDSTTTTAVPITTAGPTTTTGVTTTTPAVPPTSPPVVCHNGGVSLNGGCICPDEWTGESCSEENFCRAQELDGFKFPRTPIGWFAYSEQICAKETSGAGKPQASTRCSIKNGSPSFDLQPQVLQCDRTLSDIQQNLTSPADLESLATSTQILTSRPEELTAENVTVAAQIANTLLRSPNATESVRVAAVATVSQLLNASMLDDSEENNATVGLTLTLDQLSVNLSLSLNTSQSQVVQPNLAVQSAQIPAADTQGVQFTSLSGTTGSFVASRIQLNTNTSAVVVENGFVADALIYIRFPPEAVSGRQVASNVSLGFVLYQNNRFFRSRRHRRQRASVRVLSASVKGQEDGVVPQHVEMLFRPTVIHGDFKRPLREPLTTLPVFSGTTAWDDWSTDGCSKGNASDGLLRCFCNHTTNFAALWSFRENYEYAEALDAISIAGLSISILGLVVTIIHHVKENLHRKVALLCIYVSLLAFIITFLSGVGNSSRQADAPVDISAQTNTIPALEEHVEPDRGSCSAVAALLHFFLLATFMWNSIYGTQQVLLVRTMPCSLPSYWTKLSVAVGWGVPVVVMAITLGVTYRVDDPLGYRQEEFCWLAALNKDKEFHFGRPMFWGFLLPVGLILFYNLMLLILFSLAKFSTDPHLRNNNRSSKRKKFLISFSLAVLLGLSWTLGYLVLVTTGHPHLIFSIFFCLCTTTQGFQIFVLFTARTRSFKAAVSRSVKYISIYLNSKKYKLQRKVGRTTTTESYRDMFTTSFLFVEQTLEPLEELQLPECTGLPQEKPEDGEGELAVRPVLPIQGVSVILGNNLVGAQVWADVPPPVVMVPVPMVRLEPDESERDFLTRCDLVAEQQADPSLKDLFQRVRPEGELLNSAYSYFLQDSLLRSRYQAESDHSSWAHLGPGCAQLQKPHLTGSAEHHFAFSHSTRFVGDWGKCTPASVSGDFVPSEIQRTTEAFTIRSPLLPRRQKRHRKQKWGRRGGLHARLQANPYKPALPSLFLINTSSLVNKMDEIKLKIVSAKIDSCVAIVTETWLDNNIPDPAVELGGALFSGWTGLQSQRNTEAEPSTYHRELMLNASTGGASVPARRPCLGPKWACMGPTVFMDFVTRLPSSKGNTTILTVVNRFSKMAHFIPLTKLPSVKETAEVMMNHVFRIHGFPSDIVSDRSSSLIFRRSFAISLVPPSACLPATTCSSMGRPNGSTKSYGPFPLVPTRLNSTRLGLYAFPLCISTWYQVLSKSTYFGWGSKRAESSRKCDVGRQQATDWPGPDVTR
ncbi:hypothetical protein L3Q82_010034, partial [Scortum barcoo]